jgi:PAS domain S-box-containing protein
MKDITEADIQGEGRPYCLTFHDGTTRNVIVTDIETPFPSGELIVSRTDPQGVITMVNQAFVLMAGYSQEELVGQPHHILRHPDMPKVAFKDLWDTVEAGKKWHGYVKNLRKDGGYYWVYATVVPNVRNGSIVGYTSVRREPSRTKVEESFELYKKLIAEEQGGN